ncbi:hypothetical protein GS885_02390 [Rhodococcus hoagii]|nr:hypothetical protein [Prescottella equi]NKS02662.1 hypothetical protein [Prescottella equi]NKT40018.1 hypothetical protein [Prescottella equi]NKT56882.1 hypothetical protein [Prescottella equi]NKT61665.1 hypothetical protein [Prescottella equi]
MAQDTRICNWGDCLNPAHDEWPICFAHAYFVEREVSVMLQPEAAPADVKPPALVYYLMLGPNTVKIGTTTNLSRRLSQLRSDPQYVLAVEPGGHDVEAQRHRQFHLDRIGRKEDFRVSAELEQHIRQLRDGTHSDELIAIHRSTQRASRAA